MQADPPIKARDCAVCGSSKKNLLFRQQFQTMAEGGLLVAYDVVICQHCGFVFADSLPVQEAFDRYYREMSKYEHKEKDAPIPESDLRRYARAADVIAGHVTDRKARVLDVGCANAGLLNALKQRGFANVSGLDPSPFCAKTADRLFGIPVRCGTLMAPPADMGRFDLVILGAVLEHIRDLAPAMEQVRGLLAPRGRLYVEVPDASRFATVPDAPFQEFSVEHINFFSPASLVNFMAASGLEPTLLLQVAAEAGAAAQTPEIKAVFALCGAGGPRPVVRDAEAEAGLTAYIRSSREAERKIHAIIDPWVDSRRPIIVWGVGTHTQRLLATSRLAEANIVAFVDSNPHYAGKQMNGVPILPPSALKDRPEPILVSSRIFQKEIERQIRDDLKLKNELILLYEL